MASSTPAFTCVVNTSYLLHKSSYYVAFVYTHTHWIQALWLRVTLDNVNICSHGSAHISIVYRRVHCTIAYKSPHKSAQKSTHKSAPIYLLVSHMSLL